MSLAGWHPPVRRGPLGERFLNRQLKHWLGWIERRPATVGVLALVFFAGTAAGICRLEVETDFTKNFRAGSPVVRGYETVETKLGGAGVWDVIVPAPKDLSWEYLDRIRQLEQRLQNEVTATDPSRGGRRTLKVLSLADMVWAGVPNLDRLPEVKARDMVVRTTVNAIDANLPSLVAALHGEDPNSQGDYYCRIMLRAAERQPAEQKRLIIQEVTRIAGEDFEDAEVTGFFVLLTSLIDSILRDQWRAFGVAMTGIALTMLLAFRRPVYSLVALIPNALPILTVTGLMGWIGLRINMGAAMIAAVSVGLSVDSSIHYISFFLRARSAGKTVHEALSEVQQSVGQAMVFSTLALIVGFAVLCTSDFVPTIYFGSLVSLSMLGGLLGNLIILPLLLRLVTRD